MPTHSPYFDSLIVLPLNVNDLSEASELVRLAFATHINVPCPGEFWSDRDYVFNRWNAPHTRWFKAVTGERIVGVLCVSRWGSSAILGPVAVSPECWNRGIARRLMFAAVELLKDWSVTHAGLMAFPDSPKHIGLYQSFGFWPASLIAILQRPVTTDQELSAVLHYGQLGSDCLGLKAACTGITHQISEGLNLCGEMDAVLQQNLGTTLVLGDETGRPQAFAICHYGPHSEAGAGTFYVKFAAVAPGSHARLLFARLMSACNHTAQQAGLTTLTLGVNTARQAIYRWLVNEGFRAEILGVSMHRGGAGYDYCDAWVLDDWR